MKNEGKMLIKMKWFIIMKKIHNSCIIYIVLLAIFYIINISISSAFTYFHWYIKNVNTSVNASANAEAINH